MKLDIPIYSGSNIHVKEMMEALVPLADYVHSAFIHGSIATGEENSYSDFDGLIILRDSLFEDRTKLSKIASSINSLRFYMHRHDPLQHHGWFVLAESDLQDYREDFLPVDTLKYAKSLTPEFSLTLRLNQNVDFKKPFHRLCKSIERKLVQHPDKFNLYSIKAILSEFMMLPCLYVQAKEGRGIFKKFSFEEMRNDFSREDFAVMDTVSGIRKAWKIDLQEKEKRFLERTDFFSWYRRKHIQYKIPTAIHNAVDEELFIRMRLLTVEARKRIGNT